MPLPVSVCLSVRYITQQLGTDFGEVFERAGREGQVPREKA